MPTHAFQDWCCQCPGPHSRPMRTHDSTRDPKTDTGRSSSVSCGVTAPFPWAPCTRFCLWPPRVSASLNPVEVLWSNLAGLQSQIPLGFPVPLLYPQVGKSDVEPRTFITLWEILWHYCSPVCGSPTQRVWELILTWLCHSTVLQIKKQQIEPDMEQWTGFKIGKGVSQGYISSPSLFNLNAEYIMWNAGLDESQAGIKIARRIINNLR